MRYLDYSPAYYHTSFWQGGFLTMVVHLAFWAAIIWLAIQLFRHFSPSNRRNCCNHTEDCCSEDRFASTHSNAYLHIVKERYAKGEIDKKQFEELKKDLSEEKSAVSE